MPIYLEIHKGHRSGHLNFGVMTGLIEDFTLEEMQEFRQMLCVVIGIAEDAFRDGDAKRNPCYLSWGSCGEQTVSEKLFCDFCQREIDKRADRFEVKISVNVSEVMLRRDACPECEKKIETMLVGLRLGIEPSR